MEPQTRSGSVPQGTAEPVRVLMPSPIGDLGVELVGLAVARLVIEPAEGERAGFVPFHRLDGSDFLDEVFGHLAEYFAGARRRLDLELDLGLCGLDPFARRVLRETAKIPYGRTRTYQAVAEAAGRPGRWREAREALLANPLPIVVPCHRVVDGPDEPGDYVGGAQRKRWLLELESQSAESI